MSPHPRMFRRFYLTSLLCLLSCSQLLAGKPVRDDSASDAYVLVALDERPGTASSFPRDFVNAESAWCCVGTEHEGGSSFAVAWAVAPDASGDYSVTSQDLAGGESAGGVNPVGEIVGHGSVLDDDLALRLRQGLYWQHALANPLSLSPLPGDNQSEAFAISAAGVIVGLSSFVSLDEDGQRTEQDTAVVWRAVSEDGVVAIRGPFILGQAPGSLSASARSINECDQQGLAEVVGSDVVGPVGWQVQCLADGGVAVLTGPIPLVPEDTRGWGAAEGLNAGGDACGVSLGGLAFRTLSDGTFEQLSTPRNAYSTSRDINDNRVVVGQVWDPRKGTYGALWTADGSRVDLNSVIGRKSAWHRIWWGTAIDNDGVISATGSLSEDGNDSRALLMIPQ